MKFAAGFLILGIVASACVFADTYYVDDDSPADFNNIQEAINESNNGDTIIVMPGLYKGMGNRDIDFKGKAITLRSRLPDSDECLRETILDAEGIGVIARFVNDEGPETRFIGFTLLGGDTSIPVQGVAGFFEFSVQAKPFTERLRLVTDVPVTVPSVQRRSAGIEELLQSLPGPYGGRLWDGNNPFHQPAATTDYYGSGDVDNDGNLTSADVVLAQDMADGLESPCTRADVDGDGNIDSNDVALINEAISGTILNAWWNSLTDIEQRNAWITKFMAIDQTDIHPWRYWFQCGSFETQTFLHGAFYRGDLAMTFYDGGQTMFNVPLYSVSVTATSFGHGVNAVLVGDNPLDFNDWRFLEPQTDDNIRPGMWDMPYGSTVQISVPIGIGSGGSQISPKVEFYVDEMGWSLEEYSPDLILTRPTPPMVQADNRPDLWNPRLVPLDGGMLLFEQMRDDMSRMTDIHLTELSFSDPQEAMPLVLSDQYSRLLDICRAPDGVIHLLWTGKPDYTPGVFHGILDPITRQITNVTRVCTGMRQACMGRVIVTTGGDVHVFWLEVNTSFNHPYERGIYWTRWSGTQWQADQNIAPTSNYLSGSRYYFDVDVLPDGNLLLVWIDEDDDIIILQQLNYNGAWSDPVTIESVSTHYTYCGVDLAADTKGTMHLAYWRGNSRDNILHRTSEDGYSWSEPVMVDSSSNAAYPRMVSGPGGSIYLIWIREVDSQDVPVCNRYANGEWGSERQLSCPSGTSAWYPTVEYMPDGKIVAAWSSRSDDRVTIETETIAYAGDFDFDGDIDVDDLETLVAQWLQPPTEPSADIAPYKAGDDFVNMLDFAFLARNWLWSTE